MLRITTVDPAGQASRLGIRAGDQITAIEGSLVDRGADLARLIEQGRDGIKLTIEWVTESGELRQGCFTPRKALGVDVLDDAVAVATPRDSVSPASKPKSGEYGLARFAIGLISAVSVLVMIFGLLVIVTGLAGMSVLSSVGGFTTGGGMILVGVMYLGLAQVFGALLDTATHTRLTYEMLRERA